MVTTTTDLRSLAEAVGGERVEVANLVPPNVDAEEYQVKPQDVVRLKDARVVVRIGLDFDLWFDRLLHRATLTQPNVSALRRGGTGHVDASLAIAVLDQRGASVGPGDGPFDDEEPFAAIIRCTADPTKVDKRTRSKWSRALRYALRYKSPPEPLDAFIKRKGGINSCASRFTRCLERAAA